MQEEIVIVKEGTVESLVNGTLQGVGPGIGDPKGTPLSS
jgi:hypothetical protein